MHPGRARTHLAVTTAAGTAPTADLAQISAHHCALDGGYDPARGSQSSGARSQSAPFSLEVFENDESGLVPRFVQLSSQIGSKFGQPSIGVAGIVVPGRVVQPKPVDLVVVQPE